MAPVSTEGWTDSQQNSEEKGSKDHVKKQTSVEVLNSKTDKDSAPQTVPYHRLFRFSTKTDRILVFLGCFVSVLCGGIFPTMNILLGSLLDIFIEKQNVGSGFPECWHHNITNTTTTIGPAPSTEELLERLFVKCSWLCIGILLIGVIQIAGVYVTISCLNTAAENQAFRIRDRFMRAILRQDIGWFDTNSTGDFASRITADLTKIQDGMGQKLGMVINYNSTTVISVIVAFYYGWKLTLVTLAVMPLVVISGAIITKIQAKMTGGELDAYGKAGAIAEEVISSIRTVVAFGGEKKESDRYEKKLLLAKKNGMKKGLFTALGASSFWFFDYCSYALAFWYGSKLVLESRCDPHGFSPSTMFIVFFCVLLGSFFMASAAPYVEAIASAKGAAKILFDVIDRKPPIDSGSDAGEKLEGIEGLIDLKEVVFNYPSRPDVQVLKKLSLQAVPGETVALVGPSGCGKSTVVQLVQRFYDPQEGIVSIDGRNIKDLNVAWLRQHIGVVGQEPVLFDTTISENIRYGAEGATEEEIKNAAKKANAHLFIMKLPEKYNTLVGEKGAQLSGGQKQRIAIARALVRNPKILLLDEATSALDTESESIVQAALDQASVGRTTIVVAHRLSTIRSADKIIALESGEVKESGTHAELMELQGLYFNLVNAQQLDKNENEHISAADRKRFQFRQQSTISIHNEKELGKTTVPITEKEEEATEEKVNPSKLRLIKLSLKEWPYILTGTVASLFMGILLPIYGVIFGNILSSLHKERSAAEKDVVFFSLLFIVLGITTGLASFLQAFMFALSGEHLTMRLRKLVFIKIITQEMSWFDQPSNKTGALCSKLASDASGVQGAMGNRLSTMVQALTTLVAAVIIALIHHLKIGSVVIAFIPLVLASTYLESRINSGQIFSEKKAVEKASKIAIEAIQNVRTVASLHLEDTFCNSYIAALTEPHLQAKRKTHFMGLIFGFSQAIPWMANAAAMYYGTYLIKTGELFYGDLFKVTESVFAGAWVIGSIVAFAPDYDMAKVAAVRIFEMLDLVSSIDVLSENGRKPESIDGKIVFSDVHFSYPTRSEMTVLNGLNLEVNPGSTVALVGSSGCGKSTCIQLLERFYDSTEGNVKIDAVSTREFNLKWMRSQIGLVAQEPVLFGYSVRDNIAYGDNSRSVPMEDIVDAAKKANIHSFIQSLPGGYDTDVGAKGTQLSGGQKQRVAIARALVRNPKILLLDEATSALDTESEKVVQEALDKASEGRTCLTIAHRLSTIQNVDMIAVIHKGEIVEKGTHQELLSAKGFYYRLYSQQGGD